MREMQCKAALTDFLELLEESQKKQSEALQYPQYR